MQKMKKNKQYIGETKRTLRERFKENRQATNKSTPRKHHSSR